MMHWVRDEYLPVKRCKSKSCSRDFYKGVAHRVLVPLRRSKPTNPERYTQVIYFCETCKAVQLTNYK